MIFLDTNIFLYATGAAHPLKAPCARIVDRIGDGLLAANINTEVMQETMHVMVRKGLRAEALRVASRLTKIFPNMLPVMREDMIRATELLGQVPDLACRDAIHAATMLRNGITQIMSLDADFDHIPGIRRVLPS